MCSTFQGLYCRAKLPFWYSLARSRRRNPSPKHIHRAYAVRPKQGVCDWVLEPRVHRMRATIHSADGGFKDLKDSKEHWGSFFREIVAVNICSSFPRHRTGGSLRANDFAISHLQGY